jgi:hypothetical protein
MTVPSGVALIQGPHPGQAQAGTTAIAASIADFRRWFFVR